MVYPPITPPYILSRIDFNKPADALVYIDNGKAIAINRKGERIAGPSTDHSDIVQRGIDYAPDSGRVVVIGNYNIYSTIHVKKPLTLEIYGYWTAQSTLSDSDAVLQIGDTDKGYHKIFVTINGTIDANNVAGNTLKIVRAVDSRFKGGVLKNSVGANLAVTGLNSHVVIEDFTCGFGGVGVHVDSAEFIYFRNVLTYVNKNNGWVITGTNGVVCHKCISNGDASENQGTGAWVNNAFLLLGIKKYVILVNSEVWTNQNTHLNRVMDIEFDNLDEDIVVWLDNFYFRPDGGLPASLQEVFRVVTYSDKHIVLARDPVILDSGGKPVANYPNNAGMMMIHGGRLVNVAAPTGVPGESKDTYTLRLRDNEWGQGHFQR